VENRQGLTLDTRREGQTLRKSSIDSSEPRLEERAPLMEPEEIKKFTSSLEPRVRKRLYVPRFQRGWEKI
jgi:hypothetical protein